VSFTGELRDAVIGVVRRDALLFWSYRTRAVSQTLAVFFSLTVFYYVSKLVNVEEFPSAHAYFSFVTIGILTLAVLTATLTALPLAVRQELIAGTFERFVVSPTGAAAGVAAMLIFPMLSALAISTLQIILAAIVFPLDVHWSTAALAVPVALLGVLSFAPFALLMAAAVITLKQVTGAVPFVTTALAFLGGFLFPVRLLPDWVEWLSEVQPFTPALDLLRHLLVDTPLHDPAWESVLKIAAFAAVLLPLSLLVLRQAVHVCRRRGTLIEY
jgi:ABC-2 type transport system permease protein